MITVWIVILRDRHFDDVVCAYATLAGATKAVNEYKDEHSKRWPDGTCAWKWNERSRTWSCYDDGPTIQVAEMEVQP